jgi:nucleoside-diphosphate-sugar epimerase
VSPRGVHYVPTGPSLALRPGGGLARSDGGRDNYGWRVFVFRSGQIVTRILVTGASGFIGRALVAELANVGHSVRAAMRQPADIFPRSVEVIAVSDLTRPVEWRALLKNVETVVHLAGIAHAGPEIAEQAYDRVNRLATAELASAAKAIGIGHLVFMSSIRAQSGPTSTRVLRETDAPHPTDAYGRSKLGAEDAVRAAGVPFTILRPVLIYGPGVKGNFARLMELARKPWPLPLGLCRNRRSLLARRNLIDAIHLALASPAAKGETYVVADPTPLTLTEIVTALRAGEGRRPGLLPVPPALIALASSALGSAEEWQRLGGMLVADPIKLMHAGWKPAPDTRAGLAALARATSPRNAN